jgi:hypothetical protein
MAKDPAFLFYPGDWLGGTMGMTLEEKGAYIEVLMLQFNRGHMEGHMIAQVIGQLWGRIQHKFIKDENGLFFNERLELEKNRRKKFVASRNNNIKGSNQYSKRKKRGHKTSHMENENENVIDIEERKSKFISDVSIFRNQYPDEMLKEFCEYWIEHNEGGKKLRFEMQDVFNVSRRLSTWKKNQIKFKTNGKRQTTHTDEDLANAFRKEWAKDAERQSRGG